MPRKRRSLTHQIPDLRQILEPWSDLDLDKNPNWCLSGGADGADLMWGIAASNAGHGVIHFSFQKHKTEAPPNEIVILTEEQLKSADEYCKQANKTLKRRFPAKWIGTTNLLRRDWYQVAFSQTCYAVSTFNQPVGATIPLGDVIQDVQVKGGTAWAVTMFIQRHTNEACPCYMFDQVIGQWFRWIGDGWECINEPPKPQGIWAGIGIRDLNGLGKLAIRVLMDYKMDYHSPQVIQKYFAQPRI